MRGKEYHQKWPVKQTCWRYMYKHKHAETYWCIYICTFYTSVYVYVYIYIYVYPCWHIYMCIYMLAYIHIYVIVCIYIYIHAGSRPLREILQEKEREEREQGGRYKFSKVRSIQDLMSKMTIKLTVQNIYRIVGCTRNTPPKKIWKVSASVVSPLDLGSRWNLRNSASISQ